MIEINGKYNNAIVYADEIDQRAYGQILSVCDCDAFKESKIRIMSDVHGGKGCSVGTTMTIHDKVVPSMVGVDIGCGMETVKLKDTSIDMVHLDNTIRKMIPSGSDVRAKAHQYNDLIDLTKLRCFDHIKHSYAQQSLGSLGGGNHFIEIDKDDDGCLYLVIHSGSRHLGVEVAEYYQNEGLSYLKGCTDKQIWCVIDQLKAEGRQGEIQDTITEIRNRDSSFLPVPEELAYVSGYLFDDYIHDMAITQEFARLNRKAMCDVLFRELGLSVDSEFTTIHNYIDIDSMILRKGAVSAKKDEILLIPMNMRDGSLICRGLGNPEWNYSAPHGAGRALSRSSAKRELSMEEYRRQMDGIFTTSVSRKTLDESPMAYKPMEAIVRNIWPTVEILKTIKPIYNFKAQG